MEWWRDGEMKNEKTEKIKMIDKTEGQRNEQ